MEVKNHLLYFDDGNQVPFVKSPNYSSTIKQWYLLMHYTAGSSAEGSINWFQQKQAKASAHLVIGRDGKVTQMVPFNKCAWHAGKSRWEGLVSLSYYSIGIEMDNAGLLTRKGGKWTAWFGKAYPDEDVLVAKHRFGASEFGWHTYTEKQIEVALEVGIALMQKYNFRDVLGHEDVSPQRKWDPGPAFPLDSFCAKVLGRKPDEKEEDVYLTITDLNVRTGPGTENEKLAVSPLPPDTRVAKVGQSGVWFLVDVLDTVQGEMDVHGWVHSRYLKAE